MIVLSIIIRSRRRRAQSLRNVLDGKQKEIAMKIEMGYQHLRFYTNLTIREMSSYLKTKNRVGYYYAGHGMSVNSEGWYLQNVSLDLPQSIDLALLPRVTRVSYRATWTVPGGMDSVIGTMALGESTCFVGGKDEKGGHEVNINSPTYADCQSAIFSLEALLEASGDVEKISPSMEHLARMVTIYRNLNNVCGKGTDTLMRMTDLLAEAQKRIRFLEAELAKRNIEAMA